jgi:hypothetical protein
MDGEESEAARDLTATAEADVSGAAAGSGASALAFASEAAESLVAGATSVILVIMPAAGEMAGSGAAVALISTSEDGEASDQHGGFTANEEQASLAAGATAAHLGGGSSSASVSITIAGSADQAIQAFSEAIISVSAFAATGAGAQSAVVTGAGLILVASSAVADQAALATALSVLGIDAAAAIEAASLTAEDGPVIFSISAASAVTGLSEWHGIPLGGAFGSVSLGAAFKH